MITPLNMEKSRPYQLHDASFQREEFPNEKKHASSYSVEDNAPLVSLSSKDEKMSIASILKSAISEMMSLSGSESNNVENNETYFNDSVSNISNDVTKDDESEEHIAIMLDDISKSLSMNLDKISDGIESISNLVLSISKNVGEKVSDYISGKSNVLTASTDKSPQENKKDTSPDIFNSTKSEENTTVNNQTKFNNEILNLTKNSSKILTSISENIENKYLDVSNESYSSNVEGSKTSVTNINKEDSPVTAKEFLEDSREKIATLTDKIIQSVFSTAYSAVDNKEIKNSFITKLGNSIPNLLPGNKTKPSILTTNITNLQRSGDLSSNKTSVANSDITNLTKNVENTTTNNQSSLNNDYKTINNFEDSITSIEKKNGDVSNNSTDFYNNFSNSSKKEDAAMNLTSSNSELSENDKSFVADILDIGKNILKSTENIEETVSDIIKEEKGMSSKVSDITSLFNDFFELQSEENLTDSYSEKDTNVGAIIGGESKKESNGSGDDSSFFEDMIKYKILGFLGSSMFLTGILPVAGAILNGLAAGGIIGTLANKYLADPIWDVLDKKRLQKEKEENIKAGSISRLKNDKIKNMFGDAIPEEGRSAAAAALFPDKNATEEDIDRIAQDYKITGAKSIDEYRDIRGRDTEGKVSTDKIDFAIKVIKDPMKYTNQNIQDAYNMEGVGTDKFKNLMNNSWNTTMGVNLHHGDEYVEHLKKVKEDLLKKESKAATSSNLLPTNSSSLYSSETTNTENNVNNTSNTNKTEFSEVGNVVTTNKSVSVGDAASSNMSPAIANVSTNTDNSSTSKNLANISKSMETMVELNKGILQATAGFLEKPMPSGGGGGIVPVIVGDDFSAFDKASSRARLAASN